MQFQVGTVLLLAAAGVVAAPAQGQSRDLAAFAGCYVIRLDGWYEAPMTRDRGPYAEKTPGYKGLPKRVGVALMDTNRVSVRTLSPDSVVGEWSAYVTGDTLHLGWPKTRFIWGLLYTLIPAGDSLQGVTWYWSHVLRGHEYAPLLVPTVWTRTPCLGSLPPPSR